MRPTAIATAVAWAVLLSGATPADGQIELYVAPNGSDADPGTRESPLESLEGAREAIRKLRQAGVAGGPVTVWIRGGVYYRTRTFALTKDDSGSREGPVTYRACENEEVRLQGGRGIDPDWCQPVTDRAVLDRLRETVRDKVLQVDLMAHGITDYGELGSLGGGMKLFCNGRRMPLARWPNEGWALARRGKVTALDAHSVPILLDQGREGRTLGFKHAGGPPSRWRSLDGVWLRGYWHQEYSFEGWQPRHVDLQRREITLDCAAGDHLADWRRFYAANVFEEIDQPGEWYLDRRGGVLYFFPPEGFPQRSIMFSLLGEAMVSLQDTSYVTIRGLTLEVSRGVGAVIGGGTHNRIAGCTIRNMHQGVILGGGSHNGVLGCDLFDLDSMAVRLSGGDRVTLTPAGLYAVNNHIHHFARCYKTWHPGVQIEGVGNRVAHNRIHHAPQYAISYRGNDHLIELNNLHHLCLEMSDVGVVGCGGDWTFRGNVVRYNFIHHIPHRPYPDVVGVYLDDGVSSTRVFGNVFYDVPKAVLIGGGRDHAVENNLFIKCDTPIWLDNRGLRWDHFRGGGPMYQKLNAVPYRKPPWSTRYPKLARILEDTPQAPLGNVIARNVSYRSGWRDPEKVCREIFAKNIERKYCAIADNLELDEDPGFVDAPGLDFRLRDDSTVFRRVAGFKKIPFSEIGPYRDEYRSGLPAVRESEQDF